MALKASILSHTLSILETYLSHTWNIPKVYKNCPGKQAKSLWIEGKDDELAEKWKAIRVGVLILIFGLRIEKILSRLKLQCTDCFLPGSDGGGGLQGWTSVFVSVAKQSMGIILNRLILQCIDCFVPRSDGGGAQTASCLAVTEECLAVTEEVAFTPLLVFMCCWWRRTPTTAKITINLNFNVQTASCLAVTERGGLLWRNAQTASCLAVTERGGFYAVVGVYVLLVKKNTNNCENYN